MFERFFYTKGVLRNCLITGWNRIFFSHGSINHDNIIVHFENAKRRKKRKKKKKKKKKKNRSNVQIKRLLIVDPSVFSSALEIWMHPTLELIRVHSAFHPLEIQLDQASYFTIKFFFLSPMFVFLCIYISIVFFFIKLFIILLIIFLSIISIVWDCINIIIMQLFVSIFELKISKKEINK